MTYNVFGGTLNPAQSRSPNGLFTLFLNLIRDFRQHLGCSTKEEMRWVMTATSGKD